MSSFFSDDFLGRLCYARSAAKLLRINLENWIENSCSAGAVRIKSPSLVAYLYPEPFKCEEMRDECRPFPSNGNAMAAEHRGCVPPPSRSDGNPRRKKKKETRLEKNQAEVEKSRENSTNFRVTRHKERVESDTNFRSAPLRSEVEVTLDGSRARRGEILVYLPKGCRREFYYLSTLLPRGGT